MRNIFHAGLLLVLAAPIGCFPSSSTSDTSASSTSGSDDATPRETVGKTTQNVLDLEQALSEGAVLASTKIESKNPLMINAEAYRTSVGKIGGMGVEHAIQLRNAQSIQDPKPLTHEVFMAEIIKKGQPDGIRLPMLPYYQEYTWDQKNQKLVVVDFPARIEEREKQR
ncbi:hypothetical protein [Rhodopirellula sp. SWK7]|uniref:hypothetical protein n=1 Tax=Rhodopirellula sp. SWK7 TaxID=595460 RepID=UPI0002BF4FF5|nr:hypothetical protein [Rhodopirellula sp. SWK7]EMI44197.1 putative secreted protein [Rhodopirellula sp. SWK7]